MKKQVRYLLIATGVGLAYYGYKKQHPKTNFLGGFGLFITNLLGLTAKPSIKSVLFIGDSITADPTWSYPALIRKARPDLNVDVLAKAGQTTEWMKNNLPLKLSAKKYDMVYIYGGTNDTLNNQILPATSVANVQNMVDQVRAKGSEAYVILGYEPVGFMDVNKMPITQYVKRHSDYKPFVERYKYYQSQLASKIKNATLVPKFNLGNNSLDGIHPNGTGQDIIKDKILSTL